MAGGMQRGRSGRSLGERAASSGVASGTSAGPLEAGLRRPTPPPADGRPDGYAAAGDGGEGRHCWVRDPAGAPGTWPGLLVEWRQRAGTWQGRVVYSVTGPHGAALVEAWLPAARLEPR